MSVRCHRPRSSGSTRYFSLSVFSHTAVDVEGHDNVISDEFDGSIRNPLR